VVATTLLTLGVLTLILLGAFQRGVFANTLLAGVSLQ
jgi:hypothetical protein